MDWKKNIQKSLQSKSVSGCNQSTFRRNCDREWLKKAFFDIEDVGSNPHIFTIKTIENSTIIEFLR